MGENNCGPDIVKYFVVEPANDVVTGATGNFFVCSGTTFLSTISGCTNSVDFNGNTFYNNSDVFFNGVITACTGIHTSNIYGCSPITVHDELILLNKLTLSAITQDNSLTQILARDSSDGTIKYRDVESIISASTSQDTFVSGGTYNEGTTSIDFSGNSVETTFSVSLSGISSNIDIYNTYFVSPTGDDSTAVRGDLHNPFKTITAARNKVVAELSVSTVTGSTLIHVYPGSYTEDEIQYENGNFYFEPGATIDQPNRGGSLIGVFNLGFTNTIQPNTYTADTCNIYGHVDINLGGGTLSVAHFMRGNSESTFEFNKINIGNGFGLVPWDNAKLVAKGIEIDGQTGQYCLRAQGNSESILNIKKVTAPSVGFGLHWRLFNGLSYVNVNEIITPNSQIGLYTLGVGVGSDIVVDYGIVRHVDSGSTYVVNNFQQSGGKITYRGNISSKGNGGAVYNNQSTGGKINIIGDIKTDSTAIQLTSSNTTGNTLNYGGNITTTNAATSIGLEGGSIKLDGSLNGVGGTANGIDVSSGVNLSVGNFSIENVSGNSVTGTGSIEILNNLYIDKPLTVTTTGQYTFTGTTYDSDLNIYNTPINDNSLTQILGRNSVSGDVEYRDVQSIISASTAQDTYVTGFTYDNINTFTISDNSGNTFNTSINVLSATTISATTYFGDGSNLTGIYSDYLPLTGGTLSGGLVIQGTSLVNNGLNAFEIFSDQQKITLVDSSFSEYRFESGELLILGPLGDTMKIGVTSGNEYIKFDATTSTLQGSSGTNNTWTLPDATGTIALTSNLSDKFVVSGNADASTSLLTFINNSGGTFNVTNSAALFSDNDINVTGGTYNPSNGCITFGTNSGTTFDVCGFVTGFTDSYTTDAYLSGTEVRFDNSVEGTNYYNVDLLPLLSGKTNNTTFNTYTANTQVILDGKIDSANNVGGANEFFKDKSGTTLNFRTLSGGSNTTISTIGNVVKVDVTIPTDSNTFVTGFTYDNINTFTISDNDGSAFTTSINVLSATTISATTYYGDGSNLTGISTDDNFVTGGTLSGGTLTLERQNGIVAITGFTTGSPYTSWFATGDNQTPSVPIDVVDTFELKFTGFISSGGAGIATDSAISANEMTIALINNGGSPTDNTFYRGDGEWQSPTNTFVTGFTYNDNNTFTIFDNDGGSFPATINQVSGLTVNGTLSATTYYGDGSNLTGISTDDNYVTGGTYNSGTLTLDRQNGSVTVTGFTTDTNTTVTGFTYNDANTFTISDSDGSNYSASIDTMTGLTVNGNSVFSGSSTDVVTIIGSGSTTPILRVEGSAGELFSITDSLTGELFAVNNISAETILSVNSDNTILWGDPTVPSLNTTVKKSINSGLSEIYSIPVSAYTGGFFDYTVTGAGARAGSIMSIFSGTTVQFNETTTNDIGDTSGITFDMNISGGTANLTVSATTNSWEIRTIVRSI